MAQNPDEIFDVVDADDRVIGQATRAEVHRRGLWHRAIHVWVFNRAGDVFLQKRSLAKDMSPGRWDSSCSGHLDAGEDYDSAAARELAEELGLTVSPAPSRWLRLPASEETAWEFVWVYRCVAEGPFTLQPAEIERGEWVSAQDLAARLDKGPEDFCPAVRLIARLVAGEKPRERT